VPKPSLNVFSGAPIPCGHLDRSTHEADTILFTYHKDGTPEQAVSLTMPMRADQYDSMGGLLPLFEMNLPEGMLRERLRIRFAKTIDEFDDLDLLTLVGRSQIGRLRYTTAEQLIEAVPTQNLTELLAYRGTEDLFADLLEQFAVHSGVSGVQPKVLVRDAAAPPLDKVTHRGATHIVKAFDAREYPELAANEWVCMQGAAAAGIRTARVTLAENRRLLLVERFDRTARGDYLGIEDFCVLDGRRAHGRYDGSYERIAKRISDFVSAGALAQSREQFALMVAYNCTIENGDAHLKNFSVLYDHPEAQVSLSPAYDLVCTTLYQARDTLALTLGGSKVFPPRQSLIKFIRGVTGCGEQRARVLLDQVKSGVQAALRKLRTYQKAHPDADKFVTLMSAVFKRGLERLRS
jgi:serine/threonine-protein kinase HipA